MIFLTNLKVLFQAYKNEVYLLQKHGNRFGADYADYADDVGSRIR